MPSKLKSGNYSLFSKTNLSELLRNWACWNLPTEVETQFSPRGNELEWQHRLQTRTQRSGEVSTRAGTGFLESSAAARSIEEPVHPRCPVAFCPLMREMPLHSETCYSVAICGNHATLKRLHKEIRSTEDVLVVQQTDAAESSPSNAVYYSGNADANLKIQELTNEVQRLSDEPVQLKGKKFRPRQQPRTRAILLELRVAWAREKEQLLVDCFQFYIKMFGERV